MLLRSTFRQLAIDALLAANTLAGENVFLYAWPTNTAKNPAIVVNWGRDVKISNSRTTPNFTSTFTLRLDVRVEDTTMETASAKLDILLGQIEKAILANYALNQKLQQFSHFETINITDSDSEFFIAQAVCDIGMETFELFSPDPDVLPTLNEVTVAVDLINKYDPSATYQNPLFPSSVVPAPRSEGPDGRLEGYIDIKNLND